MRPAGLVSSTERIRGEGQDRLTRSVKDLCGLLELFEKRKVALISVAESLDTGSAAEENRWGPIAWY